jgi:hypothetical protein
VDAVMNFRVPYNAGNLNSFSRRTLLHGASEIVPWICDLFFFCHHIFYLHMSWLKISLHINYVIPFLWHRVLNHFNIHCLICSRANDVKNAVQQRKEICKLEVTEQSR